MKQKKHWIMVKRGLSADPKHREAMGQAVWCFLHIVDRADFETGKVYDWRDGDEADDMGVNERTLRDWRQRLEKASYISCRQRQRGLEITIWNWSNPRDYGAGIINPKGDKETAPSKIQGDKETAPKGDTKGDTEGDTKVRRENVTPTYTSGVNSQVPAAPDENLAWLSKMHTSEIGVIPNITVAEELREYSELPREWLEYGFAELEKARGKEPVRQAWGYVKACVATCKTNNGVPAAGGKPGSTVSGYLNALAKA
jgi:hypothetical protein